MEWQAPTPSFLRNDKCTCWATWNGPFHFQEFLWSFVVGDWWSVCSGGGGRPEATNWRQLGRRFSLRQQLWEVKLNDFIGGSLNFSKHLGNVWTVSRKPSWRLDTFCQPFEKLITPAQLQLEGGRRRWPEPEQHEERPPVQLPGRRGPAQLRPAGGGAGQGGRRAGGEAATAGGEVSNTEPGTFGVFEFLH